MPDIDVGGAVESIKEFLQENADPFFSFISTVLGWLVDKVTFVLQQPSLFIIVAVATVIAFVVRGVGFAIFTALSFLLIAAMDMFVPAMVTLAQVVIASAVAVIVAIPVGIAASYSAKLSGVVKPIVDFMQTMPAFVYLIPAITFFGVGVVPGVIATIVFAIPPGVRLAELGIRQVDPEMVEAGEAFGTRPSRILTRIQIPLALSTIMAGVNQVIMLALSMVIIAGFVGAGGLGAVVIAGISRLEIGTGFEGGLAVVIIAIFLDRVTAGLGQRSSKFQSGGQAAEAT